MLSNAKGFGAKSVHYIYENLRALDKSIADLFDLNASELSKLFPEIGKGRFSKANFACLTELETDDALCQEFEKLKSDGIAIIGLDDDRYPKSALQNLRSNAPPILYCKGYLPLLNQTGVAIVGSREVGEIETKIAKRVAQKLAENGINVISGYAKGVDAAAHLGALESGGTTTMILSFGINHAALKQELKDFNWKKNALFVTQFAPNEKFSGANAMMRNKLVCAMSKAVVVIKSGPEKDSSGKMSGTFDAGKSALEMDIPVFALSPSVLDCAPQGNIDLIKRGAREFSDAEDIIAFLEECAEPSVKLNEHNGDYQQDGASTSSKPYQTSLFP